MRTSVAIIETVAFLNSLADRLDGWAEQSRSGGWSTHQVEPNRKTADECRRSAARLNRAFLDEPVIPR